MRSPNNWSRGSSCESPAWRVRGASRLSADILSTTNEQEEVTVTRGLSGAEASAAFIIACVGSGVVVFPAQMAEIGVVLASVMFTLTSAACAICGLLVVACCSMAEEALGQPKGTLATYEAMVAAALGPRGKAFLSLSKNFYFCGLLIVYMILESSSLSTWIPWTQREILFIIVLPVFLLLGMLRDLKAVSKLSCVGMAAALIQPMTMEVGAILDLFREDHAAPHYKLISFDVGTLGAATATFVFAFGSIATIPTIRAQMEDPDELPNALKFGFVFVCVIYGSIMALGYAGFGDAVADNMIDDITKRCEGAQCIVGSGAAGTMVISLLMSTPTFLYVIFSTIQASGTSRIHKPLSFPNIVMRVSIVVVLGLISSVVPYVKEIIGLLSAVFGVCNIIAFPMACYYSLRLQPTFVGERVRCALKAVHGTVCLIALVTLIFGVYGGVLELKQRIEDG